MKKAMSGDREPSIVMMICISQFGSYGRHGFGQRYVKFLLNVGVSVVNATFLCTAFILQEHEMFYCTWNKCVELCCEVTATYPIVFLCCKSSYTL